MAHKHGTKKRLDFLFFFNICHGSPDNAALNLVVNGDYSTLNLVMVLSVRIMYYSRIFCMPGFGPGLGASSGLLMQLWSNCLCPILSWSNLIRTL